MSPLFSMPAMRQNFFAANAVNARASRPLAFAQVGKTYIQTGVERKGNWPNPLVAFPQRGDVGRLVQLYDGIRITSQPVEVTRIPPLGLFQIGTSVFGSPVAAVDVAVHRVNGDLLTGGVVGILYQNGKYNVPAWSDARRERPWVTVRRNQVVRAWRGPNTGTPSNQLVAT